MDVDRGLRLGELSLEPNLNGEIQRETAVKGLHPDYLRTLSDLKSCYLGASGQCVLKRAANSPFFTAKIMNYIGKIKAGIIDILAAEGEPVLGSQLGSKFKTRVKDIFGSSNETSALEQFKAEYGGVGRFLSTHCQGDVTVVGKQGLDNLYALVTPSNEEENTENFLMSAFRPSNITRSKAWRIFANPSSEEVILVKRNEPQIEIVKLRSEEPHEQDSYVIRPTTSADHREMIADFLSKNVRSDDSRFADKTPFEGADYWSRWQDVLREDKALSIRWSSFRKETLLRSLIKRVADLGLGKEDSTNVLKAFFDGDEKFEKDGEDDEGENDCEAAKEILLKIIGSMDIEDLREIRIPLKYFERK